MKDSALTLVELNSLVRRSIETCLPESYWIQAELSDVRTNASGHCYLEFVQKDARGSALIAKARGVIWANVFNLIKPYFEETTGQPLHSGLKVLVEVSISFHELYGYSLTVQNIDPTYTIGDMVRRRQEIINQLEQEGVLTLNKELDMPLLPQRIAVISSGTAAGYEDFLNQLKNNEWNIPFYMELFPAIMQGDQVERTVLGALDSILNRQSEFDVVVIIRGGGSTSDLTGFDTYLLAASCAQYPLPIITGIGHERDDTVLDLVSHTRVKTPTAAAEFLISKVVALLSRLNDCKARLNKSVNARMQYENQRLSVISEKLPSLVRVRLAKEQHRIEQFNSRISSSSKAYLKEQNYHLNSIALRIQSNSPEEILKKGYAMILSDGKIVSSINKIDINSELTVRLTDGELRTQVKSKTVKDEV